jgi:hypothetical protein
VPEVNGAKWNVCSVVGDWIPLPNNDIRSRLPVEIIRDKNLEVIVRTDGKRRVVDPKTAWHEFLGKGAGRAKCGSVNAETKCLAIKERYNQMKAKARQLIELSEGQSRNP